MSSPSRTPPFTLPPAELAPSPTTPPFTLPISELASYSTHPAMLSSITDALTNDSSPSPSEPPRPLRGQSPARPRSTTVSAAMMREAAARAADTREFLEEANLDTTVSEQDSELPVRPAVSTPDLVFPSIRPSLTPPRSPPSPPAVEHVHASAEITAPRAAKLTSAAQQLELSVSAERDEGSRESRKGKKRARLATPSPPTSPTLPRPHPGALPRSMQTVRTRLVQSHRPYALAPAYWTTPTRTRTFRRLAPATAELIEEALRPEALRNAAAVEANAQANQENRRPPTPAQTRTLPIHASGTTATTAASTRLVSSGLTGATGSDLELLFPMDLDLRDETSMNAQTAPPFGLSPRNENVPRLPNLRGPLRTVYEEEDEVAASPTLVPSTGFGTAASTLVDDPWSQAMFSSTFSHATSQLPAALPIPITPVTQRFQSQSASALAALFVPPTPAQTLPDATEAPNAQAPQAGTATYLAANNATNQALGGGYIFTDTPVGGFPEVLFAEPDGLLAGLPRDRVNAIFGGDIGPALVLHVHNSTFPPQHELRPLTSAIEGAIRQITGELNPLVVPPEREWTPGGDRRINPFAWTVLGISESGVNRVLERPVWSSTQVTMHVAHARIEINRFLFVLGGFAHDHNHSILNAVWAVFTGAAVLPTILRLVQTHPAYTTTAPEEAARAILASLEVRVSTLQNGNIIAAVFCDPPTLSIARWREWRNNIANLPFPNPMNSTGYVRRPIPCAGCHGYDHPTHLCPFQDVPGWNAPPPGTTWGPPAAPLLQGLAGGPPPPPPPPGGGAVTRARTQGFRRSNSSNTFAPPRRDYRGGGDGKAGGSGGAR
ncbi:hypothetical protein TRAPUB_14216 [Trametes pubescens]|uniref:Uncharacterized protein n=1 Tax=Trametes pubescens TaxID=154538 RepID=A0A1M2W7P8_TRAPU|nr:hypothetical protein TRAPUB_14216 [Trametes pubescens]